jgi:hypothetical protein
MALYYGFAKTTNYSESGWFFSKCAGYGLIGLGLAAVYWLPAFVLLPEVASKALWVEYVDWKHWMLFDSQPKFNGAMIMLLQIWLVIATVLSVAFANRFRQFNDKSLWALAPLVVGWIFMTPISWLLWKVLPFLQAIQFPWRFMMVAEFGLPLVIAAFVPKTRIAFIAACVAIMLLAGLNGYFGHRLAQLNGVATATIDGMLADHLSAWEYLPNTAFALVEKLTEGRRDVPRADWSANPSEFASVVASPADTKTSLQSLSSRLLVIDVDAAAPTHLIVHQFYWHLWQAHDVATGQEIKLSAEPKFGLLAFDVAAGKSKIVLNLAYSWTEKIGFAISALSAALLFMIFVWLRRTSRKRT